MKVSTGTEVFDDLLEGGLESDTLTTIYGPSSSGKTTFCILASIQAAKQKKKVIYIDTESGFSIERFKQIAGNDFEQLLEYIMVLKPSNYKEQLSNLEKLKVIVNEKIGLIVIDTLTAFYRLEMAKSKQIKELNTQLIEQMSFLSEISNKNHIPILITNQVYSDFDKKDDVKMVGGNILRYNSKTLLKLSTLPDNKRQAEIISHRSIPESKSIKFVIINEGVISV